MLDQNNLAQLYDNFADDIVDVLIAGQADIKMVNQIDLHHIPEIGLGRSTLAAIVFEIGNRVIEAQYRADIQGHAEIPEIKQEMKQLEAFLKSGSVFLPVIEKVKLRLAGSEG
jgi:hypothetical protein